MFSGKELVVNVACPKGTLTVEILDQDGKPIAGHAKKDCDAFTGDAIRQTMTWNGQSDVSALSGKTVRLRFHLQSGDLYSFVTR